MRANDNTHFSLFLLKRIASTFDTELTPVLSLLHPDIHDVSSCMLLKQSAAAVTFDFKIE